MLIDNVTNGAYQIMMNVSDVDNMCPRNVSNSSLDSSIVQFNASCLNAIFAHLSVQLRKYTEWEEVTFTCIYAVISILAVIGNGLVILAVIRKRSMRTSRNVLIVNLAISNLILAITNIPLLWLPSAEFEFPYSRLWCKIGNVLPGSNIYCSTCTISVMAIDRYYSVRKLSMGSSRGRIVRAIIIALLIWIFSFLLSSPLLFYYDIVMLYVVKDIYVIEESREPILRNYGWRLCMINNEAMDKFSTMMITGMQLLFLYVVPLVVLALFNVKLTRFLKMNANQMSKHGAHTERQSRSARGISINSAFIQGSNERATTKNSMGGGKLTAAEHASEKRTSRTTALLITMACSYAALWLPFNVVSFLIDMDLLEVEKTGMIVEKVDQLCKIISMLSICVNPFLYGYLNTNFRHEFTEIVYKCCFRCAPTEQRMAFTQRAFHPEYSSVGYTLRKASTSQSRDAQESPRIFSALRRSFRDSFREFRAKRNGLPRSRSTNITNGRSSTPSNGVTNDQSTANLTVERPELDSDSISAL